MNREDYLKDYYKTLEEASIDVLEESRGNTQAAFDDYKAEGDKFIRAIAVSHEDDTAPCGRCRQIVSEFCDNSLVIVADVEGHIRNVTSIKTLLPYAFTPSNL